MGLAPSIGALLRQLHRWNCPCLDDSPPKSRTWVGIYGEWVAASYLSSHGYRILRRNWKLNRGGELDLVCRHGQQLVFVEVKTRREMPAQFGPPARAVNRKKRELIRKGAHLWLRLLGGEPIEYRYDIVEVILTAGETPHVNVLQSAFGEHE
ncbi:MAG: YraN family protein [Akkermansia sp.]